LRGVDFKDILFLAYRSAIWRLSWTQIVHSYEYFFLCHFYIPRKSL
jgi:hypothetical protein